MLKKSLLILSIIFCILFISNVCFAANTANNIKDGISSVTNTVVDGAEDLAHDVRNGVGDVENGIEDALTMDNNTRGTTGTMTDTNGDNNGYTSTRTATTRTTANDNTGLFGTDSSTMWVWLIVAVAAIVIISLVWYYGSQNRVD